MAKTNPKLPRITQEQSLLKHYVQLEDFLGNEKKCRSFTFKVETINKSFIIISTYL